MASPRGLSLPTRAERRALRRQTRAQGRAAVGRLKRQLARERSRPEVAAALDRQRRRRRKKIAAVLWAILILILFLQIDCQAGPAAPAPVEVEPASEPEITSAKPKPKRHRRRLRGKIDKSEREAMEVKAPPPPSWLAQFRLQVAARSPRLAACFNGVERPGALRWSALVHAKSGRVEKPVIEPAFRGGGLTTAQEACLVKNLTEPPYTLDEPDPEAAARRISLIIEF